MMILSSGYPEMPKPASKPIIAIDIDEVLTPHFQDLIDWYNRKYKTKLTLKHNHPTDPRPWGTDDINVAIRRVHGYYETPQFLNSQPYEEAIRALRHLSRDYSLVVITARDTIIEKVTRDWLDEHFGELISEAHFTARYSLMGKVRTKVSVCLEIGAEYLIDDGLENVIEASAAGIKVLLYGDYPWNETKELPPNVTRVKDWQEVLEYFDGRS